MIEKENKTMTDEQIKEIERILISHSNSAGKRLDNFQHHQEQVITKIGEKIVGLEKEIIKLQKQNLWDLFVNMFKSK